MALPAGAYQDSNNNVYDAQGNYLYTADPATGNPTDPTNSGTVPVDTTEDGGTYDWGSILSGAGDLLVGGAALTNAINGKPNVVVGGAPVPKPGTSPARDKMTWIMVASVLVIIVVVFVMLKK